MLQPQYVFSVNGPPGFKQRARQGKKLRGGKVITYTPKKTRDYEKKVKSEFISKYGRPQIFRGPLTMDVQAFFPITEKAHREIIRWQDGWLKDQCSELNVTQATPYELLSVVGSKISKATPYEMLSVVGSKISKPDWDNIGKVISDALNGLAYRDDSQLVNVNVSKYWWWGDCPDDCGVIIRIYQYQPEAFDLPLPLIMDPLKQMRGFLLARRLEKNETARLCGKEESK